MRRVAAHLAEVAQIIIVGRPLTTREVGVVLATAEQDLVNLMDAVAPRNAPPHVVVLTTALIGIKAAHFVEYTLANHNSRGRSLPALMAEGLDVGPALKEPRPANDFASIGVDLDKIAGDHIRAGSLGFGDLAFELRRKPQIIIVQESDPFTPRPVYPSIPGDRNIAVVEFEIYAADCSFSARAAHVVGLPVRNYDDFVISEGLRPHAGERFGQQHRAVMGRDDD